jgi:hypothetical protein
VIEEKSIMQARSHLLQRQLLLGSQQIALTLFGAKLIRLRDGLEKIKYITLIKKEVEAAFFV